MDYETVAKGLELSWAVESRSAAPMFGAGVSYRSSFWSFRSHGRSNGYKDIAMDTRMGGNH